jgi:MFS family permease
MTTKRMILVCLASATWAFSFGTGTQASTHWLNDHGASETLIGWSHACYYLGLAATSLFIPTLTRRFGSATTMIGMLGSGITLIVFPWCEGAAAWCLLRLANGGAGALTLIPLESLVSRSSDAAKRTRNFGFYAVALTLGGALGIGVGLHLFPHAPVLVFVLGGVAPCAAALVFARSLAVEVPEDDSEQAKIVFDGPRHLLSYGTAWSQGFLEGGMLAFLSLYLVTLGLSHEAAGTQMSATMVGVILFQVPVAWLAERWGNRNILLACYGLVIATLAILPWLRAEPAWLLAMGLFVFGACSGAMYPLGLAMLGEHLPESQLPRAYGRYMAIECVGSMMGAAIMGWMRDRFGEASMFPTGLLAVTAVVCVWCVLQIRRARSCSVETGAETSDVPAQRRAA